MKKLFLIALITIFSFEAQSNNSEKLSTIVDSSSINHEIYNDIKEAIVGLSSGLEVKAEQVWNILIKQQIVDSYIYLIINILVLLGSIILWISLLKSDDKDEWWGLPVVWSLINIIIICLTIDVIVGGLVNPEYGAMKDIFQFIKK